MDSLVTAAANEYDDQKEAYQHSRPSSKQKIAASLLADEEKTDSD